MAFVSSAQTSGKTWGILQDDEYIPASNHLGPALKIPTDIVSVSLAFVVTLKLRLWFGGTLFTRIDAQALQHLTPPVWLVLSLWLVSAWWARLYRRRNGFGAVHTVIQVFEAMGLATASTVLVSFLLYENGAFLSRAFLALFFIVGVICALALRGALALCATLTRSTVRSENVLVVGQADDTRRLINYLLAAKSGNLALQGIVTPHGRLPDGSIPVPVLGTLHDLRYAVNQTHADRVFVVDTELSLESVAACIDVCTAMHIPLNCTGGGLTRFPTVVELKEVGGLRLLEVRRQEFEKTQDILKRATDVAVSVILLLILLPLLAALALAIKVTSRGQILFVDDRVGLGGRHFKFLKFRSMVAGAEAIRPATYPNGGLDGHIFKIANDFRITTVGRFMRRLSLDELPQLLNVLRGDMSLVGPRPLPARDLDPDGLSVRHRQWSIERSTIRPGITGPWQVRGRSTLPFDEMVRLDLLYARTRSYRLDLQILLETIPAVFIGKGAI